MTEFLQFVVVGLANGGVYATLALALVLIHRATGIVNFAQGEMGMFATFIAWSLINHHGLPYWVAFFLTLLIAFLGGAAVHEVVIRPLERGSELTVVMATIALLVILNGLAGWIWAPEVKFLENPFPLKVLHVGGVVMNVQDLGVIGVSLVCVVLVFLFFRFTRLGWAMWATAQNKEAAALVGVNVPRIFSVAWGISAALAAAAGILLAPLIAITPDMGVIGIKGFIAAIMGGYSSLHGAVIGGFLLGVVENLAGVYISSGFKDVVTFGVLIAVLILRPAGLFGTAGTHRV